MTKRVMALAAALVLVGGLTALPAQVRFGAQVSWGDNSDLGVGARLEHGLGRVIPGAPLKGAGSVDFFFPGNNITYIEFNYNVFYQFAVDALTPYAGGGLVLGYASANGNSNTDLGLNLGGGVQFKTAGRLAPFVEGRIELGAGEQFVITGGILF